MKHSPKTYLKLFTSTFYLSAFTFGGGFVMIPLMKQKFVDDLKWLEEEEMLDLAAIAQSSPGAIAVNAAILLGYRVAGSPGAAVSILGTVIPPLVTLSLISLVYTAFRDNKIVSAVLKGMQAGVAAVIANVVIDMGGDVIKSRKIIAILTMIIAFVAVFAFKVNVIYIILICGVIGAVQAFITVRRERKGADK